MRWFTVLRDNQRVLDRAVRWFITERGVVAGATISELLENFSSVDPRCVTSLRGTSPASLALASVQSATQAGETCPRAHCHLDSRLRGATPCWT